MNVFDAARQGNEDYIKARIRKATDINAREADFLGERTVLEIACEALQLNIVRLLIENGAVFRSGYNRDAIMRLIFQRESPDKEAIKLKIIKIMIENGVSISEFNSVFNLHTGEIYTYSEYLPYLRSLPSFSSFSSAEDPIPLIENYDENAVPMVGLSNDTEPVPASVNWEAFSSSSSL